MSQTLDVDRQPWQADPARFTRQGTCTVAAAA